MTYFQLKQLLKIYNDLTTISTKGEDTIIMAQCLNSFHLLILQLQMQLEQNNTKE